MNEPTYTTKRDEKRHIITTHKPGDFTLTTEFRNGKYISTEITTQRRNLSFGYVEFTKDTPETMALVFKMATLFVDFSATVEEHKEEILKYLNA